MALREARPQPLYAQVKALLQQEIEREKQPGDALPTEPELEQRFGVSRITIRRALDELAADGLITRQQGRGTFVREPQITQDLGDLLSWTASMRQKGYAPHSVSSDITAATPPDDVRAMLKLDPDVAVFRILRVRYADDAPMCVMTNYVPMHLIADLDQHGLVDDSLYATLVAHNVHPARRVDKVEARAASAWEAEQLHIAPGAPLLQVTRMTFNLGGQPLDVAIVASRADRYSYTVQASIRAGVM